MTKTYIKEPTGAGFYKNDNGYLFYSTLVLGPTFCLINEEYKQHTYPIDDWYWFEDEVEARAKLGLPPLKEVE